MMHIPKLMWLIKLPHSKPWADNGMNGGQKELIFAPEQVNQAMTNLFYCSATSKTRTHGTSSVFF